MYQYRQPPAIDTNPFSSYNNSYNSSRSPTFLSSPSANFASPTLSRMSSPSANSVVAQRSSTWQDKLEGPLFFNLYPPALSFSYNANLFEILSKRAMSSGEIQFRLSIPPNSAFTTYNHLETNS